MSGAKYTAVSDAAANNIAFIGKKQDRARHSSRIRIRPSLDREKYIQDGEIHYRLIAGLG